MKFSIVTPTFNSEKYIAETIESVISQRGDFNIEYIIVDNDSSDRTASIVESFIKSLKSIPLNCNGIDIKFISRKDGSMYEAINGGFAIATGDIYSWINSDDIYSPGALSLIAKSFMKYPDIKWLKGITSYIDESSNKSGDGKCFLYDQKWIMKGIYGRDAHFIQQDSVFWRSELWHAVGGIEPSLKYAGDYYLWQKLAERVPLYSVNTNVSCFRVVNGQLSQNTKAYRDEQKLITPGRSLYERIVRLYFGKIEKVLPSIVRWVLYSVLWKRNKSPYLQIINDEPTMAYSYYYIA